VEGNLVAEGLVVSLNKPELIDDREAVLAVISGELIHSVVPFMERLERQSLIEV